MVARGRAWLSWSSGKDAAFALHEVRRAGAPEIVALVTTLAEEHGRVSMHGVPEALLDRQIAAIGLPCRKVALPSPCPNEVYEREMGRVLAAARAEGVREVVFGDLFLGDIRAYREERLARVDMRATFPLWQRDTGPLARAMLASGLRAILVCVDPRRLDPSFAGRPFDHALLRDLPAGVDPCGENGEFHTFVTDGPFFREPVEVRTEGITTRDGFVYADLRPG